MPRSDWFYLRYVTLGEALSELKVSLIVWAVFSVMWVAPYFIGQWLVPTADDYIKHLATRVPVWAWWVLGWACVTWFLRGMKIQIPNLSTREWAFVNAVNVITWWLASAVNWAVAMVILQGFVMGCIAFDSLVALGKKNCEALTEIPV